MSDTAAPGREGPPGAKKLTAPRTGYLAVLRNRDYAIIWSGKAVSNLGDALRNIALIWLVKELTGSALAMTTVMLCAMLPYLILGLFAGSIVDLADRKRIMVWSDIGRGLLSLSVPLLLAGGRLAFWHLCVMAFVMSGISAFFNPAMSASIPNVVGKEHLLAANGLSQLTFQLCMLLGPALGGAIVGLWGVVPAFVVDGFSFLVSGLAVWLARIPGARPAEGAPPVNVRAVLSGVKEGFGFVLARPLVLAILGVAIGVNFILAPVGALLAIHVDTVWHAGAQGFGLLGSFESAGSVIGTLLLGALAARIKRDHLIAWGVVAMGLSLSGLVFGPNLVYGLVAFALTGFMGPVVNIPLSTWMQEAVPDRVRGRVFSAVEVGCQAAVPVALALAGSAADAFGTRAIFATAVVVTVIGGFVLAAVFRKYRGDFRTAAEIRQGRLEAAAGSD